MRPSVEAAAHRLDELVGSFALVGCDLALSLGGFGLGLGEEFEFSFDGVGGATLRSYSVVSGYRKCRVSVGTLNELGDTSCEPPVILGVGQHCAVGVDELRNGGYGIGHRNDASCHRFAHHHALAVPPGGEERNA